MKIPILRCSWKRYLRQFRVSLRTATGLYRNREGIVLRITNGEGAVGYGEIAPWPGFGGESLQAAEDFLRSAEDRFEKEGWEVLNDPALDRLPCTRAALSMAEWWANGWANLPQVTESAESAGFLFSGAVAMGALPILRDKGYSVFKWKVGVGTVVEEVMIAKALLAQMRSNEKLRLDANGSLTDISPWLEIMAHPRLEFFEQPYSPERMKQASFDDSIASKIGLDESVSSYASLPEQWPGAVMVKPLHMGSWQKLLEWRKRTKTPVLYSSLFETAVGREAALRLAFSDAASLPYAQGFGTLGMFAHDAYEVHPDGVKARLLNWSPAEWETWWASI